MPSEMKRLGQSEDENQGLKWLIAHQNLHEEMLQEGAEKRDTDLTV